MWIKSFSVTIQLKKKLFSPTWSVADSTKLNISYTSCPYPAYDVAKPHSEMDVYYETGCVLCLANSKPIYPIWKTG